MMSKSDSETRYRCGSLGFFIDTFALAAYLVRGGGWNCVVSFVCVRSGRDALAASVLVRSCPQCVRPWCLRQVGGGRMF